MRSFAIFAAAIILAVVCFANVSALPLTEELNDVSPVEMEAALPEEAVPVPVEEDNHSRHKRATCDLLSKFGVNHSACAAHCLLKRFKGGYCNSKAVCVCRH